MRSKKKKVCRLNFMWASSPVPHRPRVGNPQNKTRIPWVRKRKEWLLGMVQNNISAPVYQTTPQPALMETDKYFLENKMYQNIQFHAYPSTSANQKTTKPHLNLHLWKQKDFLENKMHHNIGSMLNWALQPIRKCMTKQPCLRPIRKQVTKQPKTGHCVFLTS